MAKTIMNVMETKEIKLFIRFLKDEGVYYKFKFNYLIQNYHSHLKIGVFLRIVHPRRILINAFDFSLSEEGMDYWMCINSKWELFLISQ